MVVEEAVVEKTVEEEEESLHSFRMIKNWRSSRMRRLSAKYDEIR